MASIYDYGFALDILFPDDVPAKPSLDEKIANQDLTSNEAWGQIVTLFIFEYLRTDGARFFHKHDHNDFHGVKRPSFGRGNFDSVQPFIPDESINYSNSDKLQEFRSAAGSIFPQGYCFRVCRNILCDIPQEVNHFHVQWSIPLDSDFRILPYFLGAIERCWFEIDDFYDCSASDFEALFYRVFAERESEKLHCFHSQHSAIVIATEKSDRILRVLIVIDRQKWAQCGSRELPLSVQEDIHEHLPIFLLYYFRMIADVEDIWDRYESVHSTSAELQTFLRTQSRSKLTSKISQDIDSLSRKIEDLAALISTLKAIKTTSRQINNFATSHILRSTAFHAMSREMCRVLIRENPTALTAYRQAGLTIAYAEVLLEKARQRWVTINSYIGIAQTDRGTALAFIGVVFASLQFSSVAMQAYSEYDYLGPIWITVSICTPLVASWLVCHLLGRRT